MKSEGLRVGVLTTSFPCVEGDVAGSFVRDMALAMAGRGADVTVICARSGHTKKLTREEMRAATGTSTPKPAPTVERDGPLTVERVDARRLFEQGGIPESLERSARAWLDVPPFVSRLGSALAKQRSTLDLLVSHWLVPCGLLGSLLLSDRAHVAIAHSSDIWLLERMGMLGRQIARRLVGRAKGGARGSSSRTHLVFVSRDLQRRFCNLIGGHATVGTVCPMGVEVPAVPPPMAALSEGRLRVLFIGRLVSIKGVDVLLEAAAGMPEIELAIAGEGPLSVSLEVAAYMSHRRGGGAGPQVKFLGAVSGEEKQKALAWAHVVAVPSRRMPSGRTEGMPRVVAEAFAAGRPVVASRVGGLAELPTSAAVLVAPEQPEALRRALAHLAADRERLAEMSAAAFVEGRKLDWSALLPRMFADLQAGDRAATLPPDFIRFGGALASPTQANAAGSELGIALD